MLCMTQFLDLYKHKGMRRTLVRKIKSKGISDPRVLEAIETVPRHAFLDNAFQEHAYQDKAFQIGEGQTISQPYTVAFQTQLLEVKPGDRILEIGTGSGYQCSIFGGTGGRRCIPLSTTKRCTSGPKPVAAIKILGYATARRRHTGSACSCPLRRHCGDGGSPDGAGGLD